MFMMKKSYEEELEGQESIYGQYQFLLEDYKIIEGTDTDKTELKKSLLLVILKKNG